MFGEDSDSFPPRLYTQPDGAIVGKVVRPVGVTQPGSAPIDINP